MKPIATHSVRKVSGPFRSFRYRKSPLADATGYNPVHQDGDFAIRAPVTISAKQATGIPLLGPERWHQWAIRVQPVKQMVKQIQHR